METIQFTLDLLDDTMIGIRDGDFSHKEVILDAFKDGPIDDPFIEVLSRSLLSFYELEGGAPEIGELEFVDFLEEDELSGTFIVQYEIFYFFGCADIDRSDEDYTKFRYEFDFTNKKLQIESDTVINWKVSD